jgi:hypothetical protein
VQDLKNLVVVGLLLLFVLLPVLLWVKDDKVVAEARMLQEERVPRPSLSSSTAHYHVIQPKDESHFVPSRDRGIQ